MPEETPSRNNASGTKRVRIISPSSSTVEKHTISARTPNIIPLAAMKNSSTAFLSTHLPTLLQDFIKPVSETFASSYATCFYKKLKSDDLRSNTSHVPSSAKFYFKPMLLDGIKKSENTITLTGEVATYVENAYHDLARFDVRAFEINCQEFATRNVRALCRLLHALAFGLMEKLI
jgi:hypothetical protein